MEEAGSVGKNQEGKLSDYTAGFHIIYGTKHSSVTRLKNFENPLEKGEYVSRLFTDLSMFCDTSNHELLMVKSEAYGFSSKAV